MCNLLLNVDNFRWPFGLKFSVDICFIDSGNVVTMECFEKIIKKEMVDPTNGKKLTDKDVIPMQRVG